MVSAFSGLFLSISVSIGCASPPEKVHVFAGDASEAQLRLLANLKNFREVRAPAGKHYEIVDEIFRGEAKQGYAVEWSYEAERGVPLAVLAGCDDECGNIDLAVIDASGRVLVEDAGEDAYPQLSFTPRDSAPFSIRISMQSCWDDPCDYAFQILAEPRNLIDETTLSLSSFAQEVIQQGAGNGLRVVLSQDPQVSMLPAEGFEAFPVEMRTGVPVFVIGLCDENCSDLDIVIVSPTSQAVAADEQRDAFPFVAMRPEEAGTYEIQVRMPACTAGACAFGLQVLSEQAGSEPVAWGSGTCFAIRPDGLLLTASHIVEEAQELKVRLADGRSFLAVVETRSRLNDLATLRIDALTPNYLPLAAPRTARLGDRVFTIGYPVQDLLGSRPAFAEGTINGLTAAMGEANGLQISIPIQPGNSGGPVVNERGEVVGVVTSSVSVEAFYRANEAFPQSLNWATRSEFARPLFDLPAAPEEAGRADAIERTRESICYLESRMGARGASGFPAAMEFLGASRSTPR